MRKSLFYAFDSSIYLFFSFLIHFIFRRGLVGIFDKLETGELEEGAALSHMVQQMHKNR